jgi:hypothetical protein
MAFPSTLDNLPASHADNVHEKVLASTVNDLATSVNNIQSALGTNLSKVVLTVGGSTVTGTLNVTRVVKDDFGSGAWGDQSSFLSLRRNLANLSGSQNTPMIIQTRAKGTRTVSDRVNGSYVYLADSTSVVNKTITGAANNGSGLIRLTVTGHTFATNDRVGVYSVGGTTEANGTWAVTVIDANTFDLQGSTFTNAYTSGGTATNRPMMYGHTSVVDLQVARGGLTGTAINADDVACFVGINNSSAQNTATEAFYLGRNSTVFTSTPEWQGGFSCVAYVQYWGFGAGAGRIAAGGAFFDASRITYDATSYALQIQTSIWIRGIDQNQTNPINLIRSNSSHQVEIAGPLLISATQIGAYNVTPVARPTGWTAATNTKTRTTFDTTTVTLPVLAAHVGAMIDDLLGEGWLGP